MIPVSSYILVFHVILFIKNKGFKCKNQYPLGTHRFLKIDCKCETIKYKKYIFIFRHFNNTN